MLVLLALSCSTEAPSPLPTESDDRHQLYRLTHTQYRNSVERLLALEPDALGDVALIGDPLGTTGFDNDASVLQVTPELWLDYALAAETIAWQVVADDAAYARIAPEDPQAVQTEGEPVWHAWTEGQAAVGRADEAGGWNLFTNGTMDFPVQVAPGIYRASFEVWAEQAGDVLAEAAIWVGETEHAVVAVEAESPDAPERITVEVYLEQGPQTVTVEFTNDYNRRGEDRNLHVLGLELQPLTASSPGGDAERDAWIDRMGQAFHRRPLDEVDQQLYRALFDEGSRLAFTGHPFRDGVATVLQALLQSPSFLYRSELQDAPGQRVLLDEYELASKLSFALHQTTPGPDLLQRADRGEVRADLRSLAASMLDDPRGTAALDHFHEQLLALGAYDRIHKAAPFDEVWAPAMNEALREQALLQTRTAIRDGWSTHRLFASPEHWVDARLAPLYADLDATPTEWTRVHAPNRSGLLTLPGFLAANATSTEVDSIHRGSFVHRRILCGSLPSPPANATPLPQIEPGLSNRERVDRHTGAGTCGESCHAPILNPLGFAFEGFDAIGRVQTYDEGPIDASGGYDFSLGFAQWSDSAGFNAHLADSVDAHRCLTTQWGRYLLGRPVAAFDQTVVQQLADAARSADRPIRDLILDLVASESFTTRPGHAP